MPPGIHPNYKCAEFQTDLTCMASLERPNACWTHTETHKLSGSSSTKVEKSPEQL